ncbi:sulfurtransferase TusA family protein [Clostridium rectalis]|uniref:sulfurtransferase TusA family protein n=1 Tax=Clostridium rectalis TaxID=2040295 RepID=UPI000F63B1B3|nr:sulfurtransferase TusA family protein [Clostridium rectalis]
MEVRELDCLYEECPIPLLKAMKELKTMKAGDVLVVHSDHSCVGISIEEWAKEKKYAVRIVEIYNGEWEIYIEKPKKK